MSNTTMGTCPFGGLWYTCEVQTPTFFGCCTSNPCNGVGCPDSDFRAAGMGTGSGPDADTNDGSYWPNVQCPLGGSWYTCSDQTPSFQGCCESNMCNGSNTVCPDGQLHPAAFSSVPAVITSWTHPTATSSSQHSTSSATAESITTATSSPSSTSSATAESITTTTITSSPSSSASPTISSKSTTPVGIIVGGVVGGVVGGAIFITVLILIYLWLRNRQKKARHVAPEPENAMQTGDVKGYQPVLQKIESPQPSPLPPSYRSPTINSPTLPDHHEIYSNVIHEVESPTPKQGAFQPGMVELPDTPITARFPSSTSRQ
ncbi:hypothetical protein ACMFMG_002659 [Clarireedia jacksonii]